MLLAIAFVLYLALALVLDAFAMPSGRFFARPWWGHAAGVAVLVWLYGAWFCLSWRPVFSAVAALITVAIVVRISDYKFRNVREPLNFIDFALIPQIWRHPHLYQAAFLRRPLFLAGVGALLVIVGLWSRFAEPSVLPDGRLWDLALPAAASIGAIALWAILGPVPAALAGPLHRRMSPADPARHVRETGLTASLVAGLLAWRRPVSVSRPWQTVWKATDEPPPVVIAVQSESFVDLHRAGLHPVRLPALEAARARAIAHGLVEVPVQGAWTLRSEFAFLAGCRLDGFGMDALHPYLRLPGTPRTLALHLRDSGFSTMFVHPFDLDFFNRRKAMPKLGFDRLLDDTSFADVPREGYYVPDLTLAERVLSVVASEPRPFFCMVATMENHNPWDDGRLPDIETPVERYVHHLRNADRMIDRLVRGLEGIGRPAVLAFYGDHVPTLPELADPFPDSRTDYFVMGLRNGAWLAGERRDRELHELADVILGTLERVRAPVFEESSAGVARALRLTA